MSTVDLPRPIKWLPAALRDFQDFPEGAQDDVSEALSTVAAGGYPQMAKPLAGLGSGVLELALRHRGDAFRVVYALKIGADIWVIHAFQKKSVSRMKTPQREIDVVRQRLSRLRSMLN